MDKSLVTLLKHFDDFHTNNKEKHKKENIEKDRVDDNYEDDYTTDIEHDN